MLTYISVSEVGWVPVGSPTEVALYVMARKLGIFLRSPLQFHASFSPHLCSGVDRDEISAEWQHLIEYPFDSSIKLMSVSKKS